MVGQRTGASSMLAGGGGGALPGILTSAHVQLVYSPHNFPTHQSCHQCSRKRRRCSPSSSCSFSPGPAAAIPLLGFAESFVDFASFVAGVVVSFPASFPFSSTLLEREGCFPDIMSLRVVRSCVKPSYRVVVYNKGIVQARLRDRRKTRRESKRQAAR